MTSDAASANPAPVPVASHLAPLDDFSDRLSPMVVKELRQGLRAKTFVIVFLTLQALLALILLSAAAAAAHDRAGTVISRIIFLFFSLAVLVIQPLRGVGALSVEIKGNTIDLMVLTRLSAWRIVTGKWVSLVSQSALLFAAIVPYLILRYFFGSMDLFAELTAMGSVFLGSALLTAVMVGLSACGSLLVRGILPVFGTPLLVGAIFAVTLSPGLESTLEFFTFTQPDSLTVFVTCLAIAGYLTWAALDFGATQIGPLSENRATLRRIIGLAIASAVAALGFLFDNGWVVLALLTVVTPAVVVALTEPSELVPVVTEPFVRRGLGGRLLGRLLYPCWQAGVTYCAILGMLVFAEAILLANLDTEDTAMLVAWAGTLLFPALWLTFFRGRIQHPFATYMLTLAASLIMLFIVALLSEAMDDELIAWMFCWLPPAHWVMIESSGVSNDVAMVVAVAVAGIYFAVVAVGALLRWSAIRDAENQSTGAAQGRLDGLTPASGAQEMIESPAHEPEDP